MKRNIPEEAQDLKVSFHTGRPWYDPGSAEVADLRIK